MEVPFGTVPSRTFRRGEQRQRPAGPAKGSAAFRPCGWESVAKENGPGQPLEKARARTEVYYVAGLSAAGIGRLRQNRAYGSPMVQNT
jgi:hypothetical protein